MNAVLLNGYGGVDQLIYTQVSDPQPVAGEVLVKVSGTSFNPIDRKLRTGYLKDLMPLSFPFILGSDVAGTVIAVGPGVTRLKSGDRVLGSISHGYAELLTAKADNLAVIPEGLGMDQAAVIPVVTVTGTQLIEKGIKPRAGDRILVTGALGSVGRSAVYIAKLHGALVTAGVRKNQKQEALLLGADQVVALDDDQEIAKLAEFDSIADTVGGAVIEKLIPKLKKDGVLGTLVGKPPAAEKAPIRVAEVYLQPDIKRLAELAADVLSGDLVVPIGKRFKLSEIREAHTAAEKGGTGKILIIP